ncbi:ferrous iron transport protein A [Methylocella sp.]|uniref:ferrous iron transport protein A n=1 Tax=Methylocella sp. TaxID=1978226 RepID=UPI0037840D2E
MTRLNLAEVSDGVVRVVAFECGMADQQRLTDLGLHLGARVEILHRNADAGLVAAVNDDARVMLDVETARLVTVTPLPRETTMPPLALSDLAVGERARIVALSRARREYRQKLIAMGLTPGVEFEIARVAPLGDPVEIRVRGFAMSLRRAEADAVAVEKL